MSYRAKQKELTLIFVLSRKTEPFKIIFCVSLLRVTCQVLGWRWAWEAA